MVPRVGERKVRMPMMTAGDRPNVVLVFLESYAYSATSLGDGEADTTPFLARMAQEGVEFRQTRVLVSHTTKALWSTLTSTTPEIEANYAESVPVEQGYEGLCSLLRRAGYRSAFFKMGKGSFESAASLCRNLGYDWAWFRENLEDPSAHLGYLAGDDMRMVGPAFEWVDGGEGMDEGG